EVGQRNACRRPVHSRHVPVRPEQSDVALLVLVRLHALEALKRIVEHARRRVEAEVLRCAERCSRRAEGAMGERGQQPRRSLLQHGDVRCARLWRACGDQV
nr:hypothetical protein [Tanacetum cinerariifolium]